MNYLGEKYYKLTLRVYKLMYLNILWIFFTLLGLGILGFFPSTIAMFSVTRKWLINNENVDIFETFFKTYKKEFFKSNIVGIVFTMLAYILLVCYKVLIAQGSIAYIMAAYIILLWMIIYLIMVTYFFPIYVHFELKWFDYIKWSILLGILHPTNTILVIGGVPMIVYLLLKFLPVVFIFIGMSLPAYLINKSISKLYPLYSNEQSEYKEAENDHGYYSVK